MKGTEKEYYLRDGVIIGKMVQVEPKKNDIVLLNSDNKEKFYFDEHPFQVEVKMIGSNVPLFEGRSVEVGDILYIDRFPSESETLLINKEVLIKVLIGNIILVKRKKLIK